MKTITGDISVLYLNHTAVLGTVNLMVLCQHAEGYSRVIYLGILFLNQLFSLKKGDKE